MELTINVKDNTYILLKGIVKITGKTPTAQINDYITECVGRDVVLLGTDAMLKLMDEMKPDIQALQEKIGGTPDGTA